MSGHDRTHNPFGDTDDAPDPFSGAGTPEPDVGYGRRDGSRVRTAVTATIVVLLLLVPVSGALLVIDLLAVRSSLVEARASLQEVGGALGSVDIDEAAVAIDAADEEIADARARTRRPYWSVAAVLPFVGEPVALTRDVVEVGAIATDLASTAVREGQELVAGGLDVQVVDGRIDLEPVLQAQALVADLPIDELIEARDRLAEPTSGFVPAELADGREQVLELADDAIATATTARSLATALPGFLGTEEPRRYFVGMQTSAELRGTGGLIGYWGLFGIDDGSYTFGGTETYESFDDEDVDAPGADDGRPPGERIGTLGSIGEPVDAEPEFEQRYDAYLSTAYFSNLNLEPDLPTTARVGLDMFEQRTGEQLDGMILLDPLGVQRLLQATGDTLSLPSELADDLGVEADLPVEDFASIVTADIYEVFGVDFKEERDDALRALGDAAFEQVFAGGWDGLAMVEAVADASRARHLQVFSEADDEQAAFAEVDAVGALAPSPEADLLAVTANNAVGGKQDVHLGHAFDVQVEILALRDVGDGRLEADRRIDVDVHVDNPLPSQGRDLYVIGNCFPDGQSDPSCFDGEPGQNITWFTGWLPGNGQVVDSRVPEGGVTSGQYRGLTFIDRFQTTPSQDRSSFGFAAVGPVDLVYTDDGIAYELEWWRQSKGIPDLLDVAVPAPPGWRIADVEVVGGGGGVGLGVYGDGRELETQVTDELARLTGTVTADTRLWVELVQVDG